MLPVCYKMNQKEEKERKHWLLVTSFYLVFYPILVLAILAVISEMVPALEKWFYESLVDILSGLLLGLIQLWLIWRCAYKKPGTALLTVWLVTAPILNLSSVAKSLLGSCDVWSIVLAICDIVVCAWWYILSLKLRKLNKKLQVPQKELS